ncbi:MFS transporter [Catellatospora sp. KI3]|uniref:MFS transporter n=1 Tax=Catellatospora sp. KI3 TaxID=3041620 RepID=UPI0024822703|nr:MFS transporter [Catellatospora sp. KI3]MDI1462215.1 MFS transporter [Catellatospora sp. KI3]
MAEGGDLVEAVESRAVEPRRGAIRQPAFRRYLLGMTIDLIGDQAWFIALAWAAARTTDPGKASLIVAVGTVPRMLLLLPAGVLADRLGALRVAQGAQALRIAIMCCALAVALTRPSNVLLLGAVALVFGVGDALRLPAAGALPPALLAPRDLAQGQGLITTAGRIASVVAGPVAGLALTAAGFTGAVGIIVVLFLLAFLAFGTLRGKVDERERPASRAESSLLSGLQYIGRQRDVLIVLIVVTALNLALAGPLNLGVVLRIERSGWGPAALGLIIGVFGAAAALGALSLTVFEPRRSPVVVGFAWTAVSAASIAALGYTPDIVLSVLAVAVAGLALGPAGALLLGLVQARTDPDYRGRVMSLVSFSAFGLTPVALAGFGFLAQAIGLPQAFLASGGAVVLLALAGMLSPAMRALTLPEPTSEGLPREPDHGRS